MLEVKGGKAGPRPPPARLSGAQSEADLKPVDQNPHGVPDPGSAGRHHDFGSFGGNCKGGEGRVRGDSAKKGGAGDGREGSHPLPSLTHGSRAPAESWGSWPPEHAPALAGSTLSASKRPWQAGVMRGQIRDARGTGESGTPQGGAVRR